jgi:hypothetical protein
MRGGPGIVFAGVMFSMLSAASPCRAEGFKLSEQERIAAERAADDWLALTDRGEHGAALDSASRLFQVTVKRNNWIEWVKGERRPLGLFVRRSKFSVEPSTTALSFPKGRYVYVRYQAEYEAETVTERVIVVLDASGKWRMCGYRVIRKSTANRAPAVQPAPPVVAPMPAVPPKTDPASPSVGTITIKPPKAKTKDKP